MDDIVEKLVGAVIVLVQGTKWLILVRRSMTMKIESYQFEIRRSVVKSFQGLRGTGSGASSLYEACFPIYDFSVKSSPE